MSVWPNTRLARGLGKRKDSPMDRKLFPFGSGDFAFEHFPSTGSWPEIDLSATPSIPGQESDTGPSWESDWIDLGGEG
jgi:hypothetical protein